MARFASGPPEPARALVVRTRPLGEKDRVLCLFCARRGRLDAVARGARDPKSKIAALAQPFVLGRFLLAPGRTFSYVNQGVIERAHADLARDLLAGAWGALVCELLESMPEGLPDERAFELALVALDALERAIPNGPSDGSASGSASGIEAAGSWFEAHWLTHQGHSPVIGECLVSGRALRPDEPILFSARLGGTLAAEFSASDPGAWRVRTDVLRTMHRLSRSRRPPASLEHAPFALDGAGQIMLARCLRALLMCHCAPRLRCAPWLEELRAARRLRD